MPDVDHAELVSPDGINLKGIRRELGLSQAQLARLCGCSIRAIQSYEQGWRKAGTAVERCALLLLMAKRNEGGIPNRRCWEITGCPQERREQCISYRSGQGHLCWFLNGTLCSKESLPDRQSKRGLCMNCRVLKTLLNHSES